MGNSRWAKITQAENNPVFMQYSNVMIPSSITIKGAKTGQILNNVVLKTICTCTLK